MNAAALDGTSSQLEGCSVALFLIRLCITELLC
jgi:hypothetical protein